MPVACLWLAALSAPASAQSFLEQLFGFAKPKPVAAMPPVVLQSRPPVDSHAASKSDGTGSQLSGGTYRTVCVRMCDGFFVPISFSTRRDSFQQDQAKCHSTCGDDARLFVHRNPGEVIEDAVDLAGRPYARLPNAFRFRKARVEGCACRPPPWSEAELARHRAYAASGPPSTAPSVSQAVAANARLTPSQAAALAREAKGTGASSDLAATDLATTDLAAALPKAAEPKRARADKASRQNTKIAESPRKAPSAAQIPVKLAAAKPQPAVQPSVGLFVSGPAFGQGLTNKPKYVWPGD